MFGAKLDEKTGNQSCIYIYGSCNLNGRVLVNKVLIEYITYVSDQ